MVKPGEADAALVLDRVSKRYRVYARPADRLKEWVGLGVRHVAHAALRDVSLTLRRGDTLGVVGDNGAGKSTLLKMVAGVIQPTEGQLRVRGRCLGILDLSAGLNEELDARANVLQQLGWYGVGRTQALQQLDDILDFAELHAVADRPIKTYSTGMRVRLGFSILTSLSPDILVVDEALSVGDLAFQQKSIRRMMAFKEQGKTILFCSHSLYQIEQFCEQALWMQQGQVAMLGPAGPVLQAYERYQLDKARQAADDDARRSVASAPLRVASLAVQPTPPIAQGQPVRVVAQVEALRADVRFHYTVSIKINGERGLIVVGSHLAGEPALQGAGELAVELPQQPIAAGHYSVHLRLWDETGMVVLTEAVLSDVEFVKTDRLLGLIRTPHVTHWQARECAA